MVSKQRETLKKKKRWVIQKRGGNSREKVIGTETKNDLMNYMKD